MSAKKSLTYMLLVTVVLTLFQTQISKAQCNNLFTLVPLGSPATCNTSDGTLGISNVTGGTGAYTFSINGSAPVGPSIPPNNHVVTNLAAGIYVVTISDGNCDTVITVTIPVNGGIADVNVATVAADCAGNPGSATFTVVPAGIGITSFTLNPGAVTNATGQFTGLAAGTYSCVIVDNNGCTFTVNSAVVDPPNLITNAVITVNNVICKGAPGSIVVDSVDGGTAPYTFTLNGASSGSNTFQNLFAGVYTVRVTDANGCTYEEGVTLSGSLDELDDCSAGKDVTIFFGENAQLGAIQGLGKIVGWSPSSTLSDSLLLNPIAFPTATTTYQFTTVSPQGCVCEDLVTVIVIPPMGIPNTFTPNGDNVNDKWVIDKISTYKDVEVTVYNRWGDKVFESDGYPAGSEWDGTRNGTPLPTATYYFIIKFKFPDKEEVYEYPGSITIIR